MHWHGDGHMGWISLWWLLIIAVILLLQRALSGNVWPPMRIAGSVDSGASEAFLP